MLNRNSAIIIAEAGDNHNGDIELAYKLIDVAVDAGADYVKFQTFRTEDIISKHATMAEYQIKNTGKKESQFEMIKKLELPFESFIKLKKYAENKNIGFMSSPFDFKSIDFLASIEVDIIKIPSGEITNLPYLEKISLLTKPIILSTGMSSLDDIKNAMDVLNSNSSKEIALLHCNTEYPTPYDDVNLNAMIMLKNTFNVPVGYSDHTLGIEIPIAAVALGASIIEKHFTLDKKMVGPDHKASLNSMELKKMVKCIRNIEQAMGDGIKCPSKSEIKNINIARKSIVAATDIQKGEIFSKDNLAIKRPGQGISPMKWYEVLGKNSKKFFKKDEMIEL
ncbi:N-acetylneuraminate synthase [Acetobacterium woodii]|uniref:N-acetylneuraminate synthase NeuB n=1 Tax=Acetobacterium woodii (strain ATCC 29683 / DSM 1030 / JCM 2381 / KCTC 1655 / WB1) TaxID=931626 RepID=H6LDS7_ACEWD|nr:N-acetylneuraminate synthase [Acetobacterium woodii]AFA49241.1 N-acetylneuraminate synthase NeuB [Acetobacterium woodii DSM 1030]